MTQAPHDTSSTWHRRRCSHYLCVLMTANMVTPWTAPHDTGAGCWHYLCVGGVMCPFHANTHTRVYFISLPVKTNSGPASSALPAPTVTPPLTRVINETSCVKTNRTYNFCFQKFVSACMCVTSTSWIGPSQSLDRWQTGLWQILLVIYVLCEKWEA